MKKLLATLALLFCTQAGAQTINNLGAGRGSVLGTDLFPSYQGANPAVRPSAAQIAAYTYGLMSGDATASGVGAVTFATVNANVGSFGSATNCVAFTTNAKGLITAASQTTCTPAIASITGLGTGVATALAANMNSSTGPIGALTPTNGNCVTGNGTAWTSAACPAGANPTATAGPTAVNGVASTYMRSDAAPAVQGGTSSQKGIVQVDGTTIQETGNVISASPRSAVRATTTTSEAILNSDQNKLVTFSNASAVACTIAQAGSGGNFFSGWAVSLRNLGAGTVTCTPTTSTVDGAANFTLTTGQGLDLYSDGTNYFTQGGKGSGGASGTAGGELQGTYPNPTLAYPNASGFGAAKRRFYTYNDNIVCNNNLQTDDWSTSPAGTNSGVTTIDFGTANAVGVCSLDLGTTTSGRSTIWGASSGSPARAIAFGKGRARFRVRMAIHVLSNGTDTYETYVGFINSQIGSSNGALFRYTHSVNAGKWQAVTVDNGTETTADTGVTPVADTYQEFTVDVNAAGTSAVFSIDGSTVATISTNIPTASGRQVTYGIISTKSAGTTATSGGYVDYMEVQQDLTTAR